MVMAADDRTRRDLISPAKLRSSSLKATMRPAALSAT